jgi:hypothetical protein
MFSTSSIVQAALRDREHGRTTCDTTDETMRLICHALDLSSTLSLSGEPVENSLYLAATASTTPARRRWTAIGVKRIDGREDRRKLHREMRRTRPPP